MSEPILLEKEGAVATVVFNRPQVRNAIDQDSIWLLQRTFAALESAEDVRAVVLRGAGDHFIAGGDITFFQRSLSLPAAKRRRLMEEVVQRIHPVMLTMRRLPQPIIASVRGAAAGWGVSLVLASDLAIAADDARFHLGYASIGTCPEGSGSYYLPRHLGYKKAMELVLMPKPIGAAEALELGFVNRVVPIAELASATRGLARTLAEGPTVAYAMTKRLIDSASRNSLADHLQLEAESFAACAATADFAEGVGAFLEKRKPRWVR